MIRADVFFFFFELLIRADVENVFVVVKILKLTSNCFSKHVLTFNDFSWQPSLIVERALMILHECIKESSVNVYKKNIML